MDLILWRHADAADGSPDLARELTPLGRMQAAKVAAWIRAHVAGPFDLLCSPAVRAQQTAQALAMPITTGATLAPGASVDAVLAAAGWPHRQGAVVVTGHPPDLGRAAAFLLTGTPADWHIDKAALWWLNRRAFLRAVISPDLL